MAVYTKEGFENLISELKDLETVQRPEVVREIEVAKGFGDLSENAEYSAAREKQSRIEGRIADLKIMIEQAEIVDPEMIDEGVVNVGSTVTVYDEEYEEEDVYKVVGATEADPAKGYVSTDSPIGAGLLNRREGDVADIETPGGLIRLRIVNISH